MCDGNPMCDYEKMIENGYTKDIPYIVWPQDLINVVIDGIKKRKNQDILISQRSGEMKFETKHL